MDDNFAVEDSVRRPVENSLVELEAARARFHMFDHRRIVDMLPARPEIKSIEDAFGSFAVERHVHVVSYQRPGKRHGMRRKVRSSCEPRLDGAGVKTQI